MIIKYLEKKVGLEPEPHSAEFCNPMELEYYILESDEADDNVPSASRVYGVQIIKTEHCKGHDVNVEKDTVKNLSCNRERTSSILNKLARNIVTPVSLKFVLDDMMGM